MPEISVIMAVFNCEDTIEMAIQSIINQTFLNWELIICDDASKDATYDKILKVIKNEPKIILLKNETNLGLAKTLNHCIKNAEGKYIARMDGDDLCDKDRLMKEYYFLETNEEVSFVGSDMLMFDEMGCYGKVAYPTKPTKRCFLKYSPFCHASILINKDALIKIGGYNISEKIERIEDYELWFRLYENGYIGENINEPLYSMRNDFNAMKRKKYRYRFNEFLLINEMCKKFQFPFYCRVYSFLPLVKGMLPLNIYRKLQRVRLRKNL